MMLPVDDIISLIPQKPPFVMVSRLLCVEEQTARSSFRIDAGNVFVKNDLLQEAGLMENIAQTAALGAGYRAKAANKPVMVGYICAVNNLEVFKLPKVDDELITDIAIENKIMDIIVISGKVWLDGTLIAQCEMKLFAGNR
jgi:predicted hotdog family 3-hydroxylacyl-ACP dehydratase